MVVEKYHKIMAKVFKFVQKDEPTSTACIAKELKVNWNTAQRSLYELQTDGKVKCKKVSGRCIWVIPKK
ncbi:hypothetical protein A3K63_03460 [Candidatus Micrarchaeota archaeon RBG_16_49_10]|nr:MAG: hypothetical protein A3K63_03460 [Candidatus Micrarchaeota archaeon RBG_16_49_10]